MNDGKWVAIFLTAVFVSAFLGIAFDRYLDHQKFKMCLEDPRCEYHRPIDNPTSKEKS